MELLRRKPIETDLAKDTGLKRVLGPVHLTLMGIGAIIGAGIFVLTGVGAANHAGPALVLSFALAGAVCACAALSYAELASSVGGSGSAYAYGYAGLGEFPAWIIGWMLVLEYTIAISAVSVGWSGYVADALTAFGLALPDTFLNSPWDVDNPGIINLPSSLVILALAGLLLSGARLSATFNAIMVTIKVAVVLLFIGVAIFHIEPSNWVPFIPERAPNPNDELAYGWQGVVSGASIVFFAYIGFDAVSTAAEECGNPQRDMPIGIIGSLVICTTLYMVVSFLLTGVMPYQLLGTESPISDSLLYVGVEWAAGVIALGAIAGLSTVMLVLYFALARVLFAISRDGLIPPFFSRISAHTKVPTAAIIIMGIIMALLGGLVPLGDLVHLVNMGTLGAFSIVCAGVLVLRKRHPELPRAFRVPWGPTFPILGIVGCLYLMYYLDPETWIAFGIWNAVGLLIYFGYSYRNSAMNRAVQTER